MKIDINTLKQKQNRIALEIIEICNDFYNLDLMKLTKKKEYVEARQMAMYLVRDFCDALTYEEISDVFKKKCHSTIIHGENVVSGLIEVDAETRSIYATLVEIVERRTDCKNVSYHNLVKRNRKIQTFTSKLYNLTKNQIEDIDELVGNYIKSLEWKQDTL